jgi:hypothetical protein
VSAGFEQLSMPIVSAPRGRKRISIVSGEIREVSNPFVASPEALRTEVTLGAIA